MNTGNRTIVVGASVKAGGVVGGGGRLLWKVWRGCRPMIGIGGSRRLAYPYFVYAFIILFFLLYRILFTLAKNGCISGIANRYVIAKSERWIWASVVPNVKRLSLESIQYFLWIQLTFYSIVLFLSILLFISSLHRSWIHVDGKGWKYRLPLKEIKKS